MTFFRPEHMKKKKKIEKINSEVHKKKSPGIADVYKGGEGDLNASTPPRNLWYR